MHHFARTTSGMAVLGFLVFSVFAVADGSQDKSRLRLEELFRWKVSDTLQLTPQQEQKFSVMIRDLSERRKKASERMEELTLQMSKSTATKETEKLVKEYQEQLKIYSQTQIEEVESLKKLFGTDKLGQYLALKSELSSRLKTALTGKQKTETDGKSKVLDEPKVIEAE